MFLPYTFRLRFISYCLRLVPYVITNDSTIYHLVCTICYIFRNTIYLLFIVVIITYHYISYYSRLITYFWLLPLAY